MSTTNKVGEKIRKIRKEKRVTLVELAKLTGVAQASLSRIETGVMMGTVDSHQRIAEALGTNLAELYEGIDTRDATIDQADPRKDNVTSYGDAITIELLTTNIAHKKIVPTMLTLSPNAETRVDRCERGVEKFYWVLEGEVVVNINNKEYTLKTRQSLYFDAALSHSIKNSGHIVARVFTATSPAVL